MAKEEGIVHKLKLADLSVESFSTSQEALGFAGTVEGNQQNTVSQDDIKGSANVPCTADCITVSGCFACYTFQTAGSPNCTVWQCYPTVEATVETGGVS